MIKYFWPAIAWIVFVTILSGMPGISLPTFNLFSADKLAHFGVYAVMAFLIIRGLRKKNIAHQGAISPFTYVTAFAFSAGYGVLMEFMQYAFFPGRCYEIDDMIANAAGAGIATLCYFIALKLKILATE